MKKFLNDGEDGPMPTNFTSQYIKPQNNKGVGEVDEKEKMKKKMKMDPKKKKKVMIMMKTKMSQNQKMLKWKAEHPEATK